jgi:hypothetical protein
MLFALVFVIVFAATAAFMQWPGLAERIGGRGEPSETGEPDPRHESETGAVSGDLPSSDEAGDLAIAEDEAETDNLETAEAEAETGMQEAGANPPVGTERPAPAGTFRAGLYISPSDAGPTTDLAGAKQHCATLADRRFGGEDGWHLANPAELSKFNGSRELKRGRYWTTALHDGRAAVYSMPSSKKSSEKSDRKIARPLCVTKY